MAQAVFNSAQIGVKCSLKDCLMLQILAAEGSAAYRILASMLEDWQLFQLRLRLERVAYRMGKDEAAPDIFFRELYEKRPRPFEDLTKEETVKKTAEIKDKLIKVLSIDKIPEKKEMLSPVLLKTEKRKNFMEVCLCLRYYIMFILHVF